MRLLAGGCFCGWNGAGTPARTAEKLGEVHFATSCNEAAQRKFNRAVALLHSFQCGRAIEGFTAVLGKDPTCAIAYWGIALSDWDNPFAPGAKNTGQLQLGRDNAERGRSLGTKTERGQAYLTAVSKLYSDFESTHQPARLRAYRDAIEGVAAKYPNDHEAEVFYALALAAAADPTDKTYADQLKAGEILEKLFKQEPTHPVWRTTLFMPTTSRRLPVELSLRHEITRRLSLMRLTRCTCRRTPLRAWDTGKSPSTAT